MNERRVETGGKLGDAIARISPPKPDPIRLITSSVLAELERAQGKFRAFSSYHEGYSVILEELDELWDEIKGGQDKARLREEATQVAAMALRFLFDFNLLEGLK